MCGALTAVLRSVKFFLEMKLLEGFKQGGGRIIGVLGRAPQWKCGR